MSYATRSDIDTIYPKTLDRIAWDVTMQPPAVNDDVVSAGLASASAEIDMFCAQRYALPLVPVPPMVKQFCIDIAIYRIALTRDKLTTEMRLRYEDAISRLTMLAAGKIGIGNPTIDTNTGKPSAAGGSDANNSRAQFVLMRRQG